MTTDSPKGSESGPAYEPGARDRVARWYRDQWGYRVNNEATLKHADDALEAVRPEVERLTAEVERQNRWYRQMGSERDEKQMEVERLRRVEARLREQLATAVVLTPNAVGDLVEFWHNSKHEGFLDDAARALLAKWGVSSAEAPQPQPVQHSTHTWENGGVWHGLCVTFECGERVEGCEAAVEYWRDQHEANTLRPVGLTNESSISSQDEGRPSGSEAAGPHSEPTFSVDDMTQAGWELVVANGERDMLLKMATELLEQCDNWDDEYGACAESVPDPACRIRAIVHRYAGNEDAASAARSEATPINCKQDCAGTRPECRCAEPAWHRICCHTPPSVSTQEETKGETE